MYNVVIVDIGVLVCGHRGPCSKYDISIPEGNFKGELEIVWESDPLKVCTVTIEVFKGFIKIKVPHILIYY